MEGYVGDEIKYEEGMRIYYNYIFDKYTKELLQIDCTLSFPDGSARDLGLVKYSFDVEFLDPFEREENKKYIATTKFSALCRTVKVTYGPGSNKEQTIEYTIPKEYPFYVFTDDYVTEVYTDRECTELYEGSDGTGVNLDLFVPLG